MVFAGLVFFIVPGVLIWIAGIYDAYRVARNVNRESLPFVPLQEELLIIYAFIVIGILGFVFSSGLVGFFPFRM
jgi:hypothetical protein